METTATASSSATAPSSSTDADWRSQRLHEIRQARVALDQSERVHALMDAVNDGRLNPMAPTFELLAQVNGDALDSRLVDPLATEPDFDGDLDDYALSVSSLVARKQADYGPHAINRAPGGPLNGINVRLHDKLQRAHNLVDKTHPAFNESIFDTYMDIAGYALIAMMVLDGRWPE